MPASVPPRRADRQPEAVQSADAAASKRARLQKVLTRNLDALPRANQRTRAMEDAGQLLLSPALATPPVAELQTNIICRKDNREMLGMLPPDSIDLVYLDPPFFSNRQYEVIWGDEAEVRSFEDRWAGGITVYIEWMRERMVELWRVLKPTGSIYLHCDPHASHYLKVMMDEVFGGQYLRNEIVWKRTTAHNSAKRFGPIHDTLLYYSKGPNPVWTDPRTDYDAGYLDKYYRFDDGDGRLYWRADLCAAGVRKGRSGMPWRGLDPTAKGMHWRFTVDRLDGLDAEGRIYWPPGGTGWPQYKRFRDELKGKTIPDIWDDIDRINPVGSERVGYPTQKPEALLTRIIEASSHKGDVVLDPFCGCGTALVAAHHTQRRWIGIDISPSACNLMYRRLVKAGANPRLPLYMPTDLDSVRRFKPFEFQNWVIDRVTGRQANRKSGDMGIDGWTFFLHDPIQIKQSDGVGRNVVDNFETAITRAGKKRGYLVAFSFTKNAREEVARARHGGLVIELITVKDLIDRNEWVMGRMGHGDQAAQLLPIYDPTRHTAEELIASDRASRVS